MPDSTEDLPSLEYRRYIATSDVGFDAVKGILLDDFILPAERSAVVALHDTCPRVRDLQNADGTRSEIRVADDDQLAADSSLLFAS